MSYNVLVDASDRVRSAGFCDFSSQALDGMRQVVIEGDEIPDGILSMRLVGGELVEAPPAPPPATPQTGIEVAVAALLTHLASTVDPDAKAAEGTLPRVLADRGYAPQRRARK